MSGRGEMPSLKCPRLRFGLTGDVMDNFATDFAGGFVFAEADEDGLAEVAIPGPFAELDLADQAGFQPVDGGVGAGRTTEGTGGLFERFEEPAHAGEAGVVEAATGVPDVDEIAVFVDAEDEGTEIL